MLFSYEKFNFLQNKINLIRILNFFYQTTLNDLNISFLVYLFLECYLLPYDFEQIFDLKEQSEILVFH